MSPNAEIRLRLVECDDDARACAAISNWAVLNTVANFALEPESPEQWVSKWNHDRLLHPWVAARSPAGQIIGFAKSSAFRERCAYGWSIETSVYVHHEHHGRRVGHRLYAALLPLLAAQGYHTAIAGITVPNPASERLHESFGFRRVCHLSEVGWKFGAWHDVGYWQLMLGRNAGEPLKIRQVHTVCAGADVDLSAPGGM